MRKDDNPSSPRFLTLPPSHRFPSEPFEIHVFPMHILYYGVHPSYCLTCPVFKVKDRCLCLVLDVMYWMCLTHYTTTLLHDCKFKLAYPLTRIKNNDQNKALRTKVRFMWYLCFDTKALERKLLLFNRALNCGTAHSNVSAVRSCRNMLRFLQM